MIETYLLEQLDAVAKYGTLMAAAEKLHITQPSMSRAIRKLEETVGVELFDHKGNRLELNEYGRIAAEYARRILDSQEEMVARIRMLERSRRTILLGSCAPGPLFEMPSILSSLYPEQTVSAEIRDEKTLLDGLAQRVYQLIILSHTPDDPDIVSHPCGSEHLFFSLPAGHRYADRETLRFADMDGESFLRVSEVGVWGEIDRREMPGARFLLQDDTAGLREIARSSTLPSFVTDLSLRVFGKDDSRVYVPISDPSATVNFRCCCRKEEEKRFRNWFRALERRNGS